MTTREGSVPGEPPMSGEDTADDAQIARVLDLVRRRTGHDLGEYKRSAVARRLERRVELHRAGSVAAYADYIEQNPEEADLLFRELLIGVTQFFRDASAFEVLAHDALPALLAARRPSPLRAWWCSRLLDGRGGVFGRHHRPRGARARRDAGRRRADLRERHRPARDRRRPRGSIRARHRRARLPAAARALLHAERGQLPRPQGDPPRPIVFCGHDMNVDPPFSHLDLVTSRNVLIYLQPSLQQQLLARFHDALEIGELLVLGVSESLSASADLFDPIDATAKVFRAVAAPHDPARRPRRPVALRADASLAAPLHAPRKSRSSTRRAGRSSSRSRLRRCSSTRAATSSTPRGARVGSSSRRSARRTSTCSRWRARASRRTSATRFAARSQTRRAAGEDLASCSAATAAPPWSTSSWCRSTTRRRCAASRSSRSRSRRRRKPAQRGAQGGSARRRRARARAHEGAHLDVVVREMERPRPSSRARTEAPAERERGAQSASEEAGFGEEELRSPTRSSSR